MTVHDLPGYLKQHWPAIREQLLNGTYRPQPVRRVEIPKPDGGVRKLGIPTVLDRFIQQAVMQVLQGRWDRTFSDHSYGFRPGRSAHQAVAKAQRYIAEGYRWDGQNRNRGRRPADAEADPFVSESRGDGRRVGESGR
jgi:RNA-directed DNA polymerase